MKQDIIIEPTENLLTVAEVAKVLRVDVTTARRWITTGAMEAVQLPHKSKRKSYRVKESVLLQMLKA